MWEEVNRIEKGGNYGWRLTEGVVGFNPKSPEKPPAEVPAVGARGEPIVGPIARYKNRNGFKKDADAYGISVTGGYVYRGTALRGLAGDYIYGDWGRIWGVPSGTLLVAHRPADPKAEWSVEPLDLVNPAKLGGYVVAFGQDDAGEIYVMTNGNIGLTPGKGCVWKLVAPAIQQAKAE
jgi:hypothetical protein